MCTFYARNMHLISRYYLNFQRFEITPKEALEIHPVSSLLFWHVIAERC